MFFIHRQMHDQKKAHWSNIYEERSKRLNILISSSPTPESNWFRFCNSFWTRSISLHEVQTLDPELLSRRNRCHMLSRHQCDTHTLNRIFNIVTLSNDRSTVAWKNGAGLQCWWSATGAPHANPSSYFPTAPARRSAVAEIWNIWRDKSRCFVTVVYWILQGTQLLLVLLQVQNCWRYFPTGRERLADSPSNTTPSITNSWNCFTNKLSEKAQSSSPRKHGRLNWCSSRCA